MRSLKAWAFSRRTWTSGRHVLPMVIALTLLAGVGDVLTTAEAAFTLFYLVPIALAVWSRGFRALAWFVIALSMAFSLYADLSIATRAAVRWIVVWNGSMELALFVVFARLVAALKTRLFSEIDRRKEALIELRHAERLTVIGRLASGVAHELGTPLNVIVARAEQIADRDASRAASVAAGQIIEQVDRITGIVAQLLAFGRRGARQTARADLRTLCETTARFVRSIAHRGGVEIVVLGDSVEADVNVSEIQQVLSNLIANAVHAMPRGGRVELSTSAVHERGKAVAVIEVKDEGTGIDAAILPRIFDPFFTTKDIGAGTGLGLSVSLGIVHDHGGEIHLRTAIGEGTSFFVSLPR